jgi:hypothetical protein
VEPARKGTLVSNRPGLACQDQECDLKCILGVMPITKNTLANAHHQRTVPLYKRAERRFASLVAPGDKSFQQLGVWHPCQRPYPEQTGEVPEDIARSSACHASPLR